jgi:hypothetical protein
VHLKISILTPTIASAKTSSVHGIIQLHEITFEVSCTRLASELYIFLKNFNYVHSLSVLTLRNSETGNFLVSSSTYKIIAKKWIVLQRAQQGKAFSV